MDSFDVAYHLYALLDTKSRLNMRLVNTAWASFFEALCDDPQIMKRMGRRLAGNILDIVWEEESIRGHNYRFFLEWMRETLAQDPPEERLCTMSFIRLFDLTREEIDYVLNNEFERLLLVSPPCVVDSFNLRKLNISDETLIKLTTPRAIHVAFDRKLELWDRYGGRGFRLRCPKDSGSDAAPHTEFVKKFVQNVSKPYIIAWNEMCHDCTLAVLAMDVPSAVNFNVDDCFRHNCHVYRLDALHMLIDRVDIIHIRGWMLQDLVCLKYIKRLYLYKPSAFDNHANRLALVKNRLALARYKRCAALDLLKYFDDPGAQEVVRLGIEAEPDVWD